MEPPVKRILIIEDETPLRESLVEMLNFEAFEAFEAEDGLQGVALARKHRPDLVICDIAMPVLDGYGVLEQLRQDETTAHIPVLFLTARADKEAIRHGLEIGAVDYITKPFTFSELLDAIHAQLG